MQGNHTALLAVLLTICLTVTGFSGCGGRNGGASSEESKQESSAPSSESSPEQVKRVNPLTGLEDDTPGRRPVAIMIGNSKEALPQRGLAAADMIYELPVEGPVTRLMAVYSDYEKLPAVGSVRSARHDFVELALPLNAYYVHFGKSAQAQEAMELTGIAHIDGTKYAKLAFYFDEERGRTRSGEHCWYTDAKRLQAGIERLEIDMTGAPSVPLFRFAQTERVDLPIAAGEVSAPLSGGVAATFSYDAAKKVYRKGEYGTPQLDENNGEAAAPANVFLMYTEVPLLPDGLHKDVKLSAGTGYYLTRGRAEEVTFSKENAEAPMKVFRGDGSEAEVNPGQSWFCIAPSGYRDKVVMR